METKKTNQEEVKSCCEPTAETNKMCCEQPKDGSSCCEKTKTKEENSEVNGCC